MLAISIKIPGLRRIAAALERIADHLTTSRRGITGGNIVYIVTDDQQPVGFSISGVTATDAHGHPVDSAKLKYVFSSSDETIATVSQDDADPTKGTLTFAGEEGLVTVNVTVEDSKDGDILGSLAANFTVTAGDPAAISGGSITFDGLTEAPDATPDPNAPPA